MGEGTFRYECAHCGHVATARIVAAPGQEMSPERLTFLHSLAPCPKCDKRPRGARLRAQHEGSGATGTALIAVAVVAAAAAAFTGQAWLLVVGLIMGAALAALVWVVSVERALQQGVDGVAFLAAPEQQAAAADAPVGEIIGRHRGGAELTVEAHRQLDVVKGLHQDVAGRLWAVGWGGLARRGDDGQWVTVQRTPERLRAVGGEVGSVLYVVGASVIYRFEGGRRLVRDVPPEWAGSHDAVYSNGHEVWASGWYGMVVRRTDEGWLVEETGTEERLRGLHGAEGTLYAVGDEGAVLVRAHDGTWSPDPAPDTPAGLSGIWVDGAQEAWAVGHGGAILRRDVDGWQRLDVPLDPLPDFEVVFRAGAELWIAGSDATILKTVDGEYFEHVESPSADVDFHGGWGGPNGAVFLGGEHSLGDEQERSPEQELAGLAADVNGVPKV